VDVEIALHLSRLDRVGRFVSSDACVVYQDVHLAERSLRQIGDGVPISLGGNIETLKDGVAAEGLRQRFAGRIHVGQDQRHALGVEQPRCRLALASRRTCDDRNFTVEQAHAASLSDLG
jgi:hypothetical protein